MKQIYVSEKTKTKMDPGRANERKVQDVRMMMMMMTMRAMGKV